jgi:hypothetical protein
MPVWADGFANESQKSTWLTILILASPVGVIFGYILSSSLVNAWANSHPHAKADGIPNNAWITAFYVQAIMLMPCCLGFFFTPVKYLDVAGSLQFRQKCA